MPLRPACRALIGKTSKNASAQGGKLSEILRVTNVGEARRLATTRDEASKDGHDIRTEAPGCTEFYDRRYLCRQGSKDYVNRGSASQVGGISPSPCRRVICSASRSIGHLVASMTVGGLRPSAAYHSASGLDMTSYKQTNTD